MSNYVLDRHGKPVLERDILKWASWYEKNRKKCFVARTNLSDCYVSTVFLGIDHNFMEKGKPILYETMIFGGEMHGTQNRYHTKKEAIEGHRDIVGLLQKLQKAKSKLSKSKKSAL